MKPSQVDASDLLTAEQVHALWRDVMTEFYQDCCYWHGSVRDAIERRMDKLQADIDRAEIEADRQCSHEFEVRMKHQA